MLFFRP